MFVLCSAYIYAKCQQKGALAPAGLPRATCSRPRCMLGPSGVRAQEGGWATRCPADQDGAETYANLPICPLVYKAIRNQGL